MVAELRLETERPTGRGLGGQRGGQRFVGFVLEIDGEFESLARAGAEHRILAGQLEAAGFNFLRRDGDIEGFGILGRTIGVFGADLDLVDSGTGCFRDLRFEFNGRRFFAALDLHRAYRKARIAGIKINIPAFRHPIQADSDFDRVLAPVDDLGIHRHFLALADREILERQDQIESFFWRGSCVRFSGVSVGKETSRSDPNQRKRSEHHRRATSYSPNPHIFNPLQDKFVADN